MKSVFNKIEKEKSKEIVFPVLAEALVRDKTFVALMLSETYWRILSSEESIVLSND